jgi:hypothetical protein
MQITMSFLTTPAEARELWHQFDADCRTALIRSLAQIIAKTMEQPPLEEEPEENPDDR